jgi:NADH:ubiquinone oxidoreductase subunit 4 (subunit M)
LIIALSALPFVSTDKTLLVWIMLLFSMIFSLIGFSSPLFTAFLYILVSQALFCYAGFTIGGLGRVASYIQLTSLVFTAPILLYMGLKVEKAKGQKQETYLGLFHYFPKMSLCILLAGWILVGVPGGPIQISEDMLSYDLIRVSPLTIIFFAFCSFANFLVFYSHYSKTFYGPVDQYRVLLNEKVIPGHDIRFRQYALVGIIIFLLFAVGIFPKLMFLS